MESFEAAWGWLADRGKDPYLLLGNGFSMAYDPTRFSYGALADQADLRRYLPPVASTVMRALRTTDFESVMRRMNDAADILEAVDPSSIVVTKELREAVSLVREALAHSIAGLHPARPYDISDDAYANTRTFLDRFPKIYTLNYDLLLYWALMQDPRKPRNDGFRDSGIEGDDTVLWDIYEPFSQTLYYLHGALHLFQGSDGLRKITWVRTNDPLLDQVRAQLMADRYPLYVAEGSSSEKMDKISRSAYLSRALRSLSQCGAPFVVYGHSLEGNDQHILDALVRSNVKKIAVSIYGDAASAKNREVAKRAEGLEARRRATDARHPLEVRLYRAESVSLW